MSEEERIPLSTGPVPVAGTDSALVVSDADVKPLPRPDLTVFQKVMFSVASFPAGLISNIKGFFLNSFLLEVAQVNPYLAGVLLLATKGIDAISDPIVGRLSDRTRSRWGRRRPYLLFGAIPLALAWAGLWMVPPGDSYTRFAYYFVLIVLVDTCYTIVHIPYTAMASEICTQYDERTTLTTFQAAASILGGVIPPFVHSTIVEAFPTTDGEHNYVLGYAVSAGVMAFLILSLTWATFFGTASAKSVQHAPEKDSGSFLRNVITCLRFTPFLKVGFSP
jgi:GPH family glycoside/pentoside/hexuronide:cation symporter